MIATSLTKIQHFAKYRKGPRILVRTPELRRPLGRPRRTWEYNIENNRMEVGVGLWTLLE